MGILMVSRRNSKGVHEDSVLHSFNEYLKSIGESLTVKTQPDPPDAFVVINGSDTWIEITDAFFSEDVAISITSYAADDVRHRPSQGGLVIGPDETIASNIESVILKKLTKQTMVSIAHSNGKGILLVGLFGPFFDLDTAASNLTEVLKNNLESQSVFESVYLYENSNSAIHTFRKIL